MSDFGSPLPPDLEMDDEAGILPETPLARRDDPAEAAADENEERGSPLALAPAPEDLSSLEGSYAHLIKLSLPAMANQASRPLAALILVGLVGNAPCGQSGPVGARGSSSAASGEDCDSAARLAAFAAVASTVIFATALCNFLLTVTWAQLGKVAIGQERWGEIGPRVRTAAAVAAVCGVSCALLLWCLKDAVFGAMALSPEVEALATPFYYWQLATLPLFFLHNTACGVLGGYQRIHAVGGINCVLAVAYVVSACVALYSLDGGLEALGQAHFLTTAGGVLVSAWAAVALPPPEAKGAIALVPRSLTKCGGADDEYADLNGASPEAGDEGDEEGGAEGGEGAAREFLCAGKDQMLRSLALSGSVYAMAICAGQLGTASLAAHQVVMALWILSSYVCDGFADIGTMLGSAKYGAGEDIGDLSVKLITMGVACGTACGLILWCFSDGVMALFSSHSDVLVQLESVWWLLCIMQPSNGAVFVLDGLLLALQCVFTLFSVLFCTVYAVCMLKMMNLIGHSHSPRRRWFARSACCFPPRC